MKKLNTLNIEAGAANSNDVKEFLKTMLTDDDELDNFFEAAFKLGGAMYLIGTHYSVVKALMSNPQWLAEKSVTPTSALHEF